MNKVTDFGQRENITAAILPALAAALAGERKLIFPPGEYHFYLDGCSQKYCFFSNNDEGLKNIALLLENADDFTISGYGAKLIFHGRISPLCAFNCRNLKVEGLTIDFEDSFVSDADLIKRENGVAWFKFYGKHEVANGKIIFTGDFYDNFDGKLPFYPYDRSKKELVWNGKTVSVSNCDIQYRDGLVGVEDKFEDVLTDAFVVKHELRVCPGMVFDNCENIQIENVTIHHAAGMGVLIQNSENCQIEKLSVVPSFRRVSVSDDALHITDCRGKLHISNCHLSGTLDDSINVHGVFRKLKRRIPGGKMYYLEAGHYQQQGVFNIHPGDTLELLARNTGKAYAKLKINQVKPCNKAFTVISFDESELPDQFTPGDPGWILETQAELEVSNTLCRPLNGRGVLASGLKNVHIAGCHFHSSGAGVFISGDHSFWYESGPVAHAVIENNFFDNCNYRSMMATREPLAVFPELEKLEENFYYHGTIEVKNNRFRSSLRPQISMMSAEHAVVSGNEFIPDETYPFAHESTCGYFFTGAGSPMAAFLHCGTVCCADNVNFCPVSAE